MDLRPDPFQQRLAGAVDAALSGVRGPVAELAAIGVPALSLPLDLGGYGLGLTADVVVNGRLGYALEPVPAYRETVLALELVRPADIPDDVRQKLLDGHAHAVAVGLYGSSGLRVEPDGRLWGDSAELPDGRYEFIVARAATSAGDTAWFLITPDREAVSTTRVEQLGMPHLRLSFQGVRARAISVPDEVLRSALERARVRQAAVLLGLADRALETARGHANRRIQYGNPLLRLQTVAHRLARLVGIADGWRLALYENAWRQDRGHGRPGDGALILATAVDHALECTRLGIQLHGVRGMLAHSTAATAYRLASVEAIRMGAPQSVWLEAGLALTGDRSTPLSGAEPRKEPVQI